jgi:hypothetical protein
MTNDEISGWFAVLEVFRHDCLRPLRRRQAAESASPSLTDAIGALERE